jgi:DNA-binding response OmpR family regulator
LSRILAVDDDPGVRELLNDFLSARGYTVETVADGPSALAAVQRNPPDLLLLDLMMPGMTGMDVLRRLHGSSQRMPVIVVTAVTEEEVGRTALSSGAVDYITKPIDLAYLERAVSTALMKTQI